MNALGFMFTFNPASLSNLQVALDVEAAGA